MHLLLPIVRWWIRIQLATRPNTSEVPRCTTGTAAARQTCREPHKSLQRLAESALPFLHTPLGSLGPNDHCRWGIKLALKADVHLDPDGLNSV